MAAPREREYKAEEGKYDNAFLSILQSVEKIQPFLDHIFSFLRRRTDFYIVMPHERAKYGFPPGKAEEIAISVSLVKLFTLCRVECYSFITQAFKHQEVVAQKLEAQRLQRETRKAIDRMDREDLEVEDQKEEKETVHTEPKPILLDSTPEPKPVTSEVPKESTAAIKEAFKAADTYNGAEMDDYKWSQTVWDIELIIQVAEGTTAKDITVDIRPDHLKVEAQDPKTRERRVIIDKPFLHRVKAEESMWHVERTRRILVINLEKTQDFMWKSVLEGEAEIDLQGVSNTRDISEFDQSAQAAIQRAAYDNHMKMLGKPTSQEQVCLFMPLYIRHGFRSCKDV